MLTAISVARQCGMVPGREAIILVNVHPPENGKPASIQWEYADVDSRENEVSDTESTDEGPTPDTEGVSKLNNKYCKVLCQNVFIKQEDYALLFLSFDNIWQMFQIVQCIKLHSEIHNVKSFYTKFCYISCLTHFGFV